ncbi:MAG: PEGA domain-containing protein [Proteobacteria bacterium]|nr:PEGA domain-containing protein [Pseudomonadota bacterium]
MERQIRKKAVLLVLVLIASVFLIPGQVEAVNRGIQVVAKGGEQIYLYKDYHALVVGVGDYTHGWPDLPNAVKDAKEVSAALKQLGVKVKLLADPTSQELKNALNDFTYKQGREKNRALIFYYAGHGETEALADNTRLGYIIPQDCPLLKDDSQGFVSKAVSMKDIETYSLRMRSKHVLMLFDSCFSGSLFSLVRAAPEDICEKSALPVRQYITAGREDEPVPDRSMFKRCLLLGLQGDADLTRDGYITGSELGMYLSDKVVQYTKRRQHPQYGKINNPDLDRGDFIFQLASSGAIIEEPSRKKNKAAFSVKCNVPEAKVFLDNRNIGSTPLSSMNVSPGEYRLRVEKDGYEPYQKRVYFEAGRTMSMYIDLNEKRPTTGRLFVETEPNDARVRILNIVPKFHQGMELEPGHYHVEVSAEGYEARKRWIELSAGEHKNVVIKLEAGADQPAGPIWAGAMDLHFEDVLTPTELRLNREDSFVHKAGDFSVGVLVFKGRVDMPLLLSFFENNMAKDNWLHVSSFNSSQSPHSFMLFKKKRRWCVISIKKRLFATDVKIWAAYEIEEEQGIYNFSPMTKTEKRSQNELEMTTSSLPEGYDFEDIALPRGLKLNKKNSFVHATPDSRAGILVMSGRVEFDSLIRFFESGLTKNDWSHLSSFNSSHSSHSFMLFDKEDRYCVINIEKKDGFAKNVLIWVLRSIGPSIS